MRNLLIVTTSLHADVDWKKLFSTKKLQTGLKEPEGINVVVTRWQDLSIVSYEGCGGVIVETRNGVSGFRVDFVLIRSVTRGVHGQDSRNKLMALMHAGLPAVNSLTSCFLACDRVVMHGALASIAHREGRSRFPLVQQTFYSSHRQMIISPDVPFVWRLGWAHAGYGAVQVKERELFAELRSLAALTPTYSTATPFVKYDYELRIQKIGPHIRVFRRRSQNWRGNVGPALLEHEPVTEQHRYWLKLASSVFGGLDICALDVVHEPKRDRFTILEVNDTAIGLVHSLRDREQKERSCEDVDNDHIVDLVVQRMEEVFRKNKEEEKKEE